VALVLTLMGFMAPAAVLGDIIATWGLSNAQAGWLGGALFVGYIGTVPVLTAYTDRVDPKRIYLTCAAIGALGNFGFGFVADGLWSGVAFRVLTGIGLAGTFMPGLKALSDQLTPGKVQQRGSTYYSSFFALGSGGSILIAGVTAQYFDWHWAFAFAGIGGLCALIIVAIVLPSKQPEPVAEDTAAALDFRPVLRDRAVMSYVVSSLGTAWEVFSARVWLVTFFLYLQSHMAAGETDWSPSVWATLVALIGVPAAMLVGELCVRYDRRRIVMGISLVSAVLALWIGLTTDGTYEVTLLICLIFGMSSYGRSATINAGTIAAADPARRGSALAVLAFVGFSGGILGPLAFGVALDYAGGSGNPMAWKIAMAVMALGGVITFVALLLGPRAKKAIAKNT
jgi:MFS family permease